MSDLKPTAADELSAQNYADAECPLTHESNRDEIDQHKGARGDYLAGVLAERERIAADFDHDAEVAETSQFSAAKQVRELSIRFAAHVRKGPQQ